jgi:hypothetical protein
MIDDTVKDRGRQPEGAEREPNQMSYVPSSKPKGKPLKEGDETLTNMIEMILTKL